MVGIGVVGDTLVEAEEAALAYPRRWRLGGWRGSPSGPRCRRQVGTARPGAAADERWWAVGGPGEDEDVDVIAGANRGALGEPVLGEVRLTVHDAAGRVIDQRQDCRVDGGLHDAVHPRARRDHVAHRVRKMFTHSLTLASEGHSSRSATSRCGWRFLMEDPHDHHSTGTPRSVDARGSVVIGLVTRRWWQW